MNPFNLLEESFPKFETPCVPLKDLGVASRVFNHWKEKGLIDYEHEFTLEDQLNDVKRKNIKLNFFDALWVLMIKELRTFNIDLKTIREAKLYLFEVPDLELITDEDFESLLSARELFPINTDLEKEAFNEIHRSKETFLKEYRETCAEKPHFVNRLAFAISQIILMGHSPFLTLHKAPNSSFFLVDVHNPDFFSAHSATTGGNISEDFVRGLCSNSLVSIPIKPLFEQFFVDKDLLPHAKTFEVFNERELQILKMVKGKDFTKIIIHKNADGVVTIERNERKDIKGHNVRELYKHLGMKSYERIELINRNSKHIVVNTTQKEKIDLGKT